MFHDARDADWRRALAFAFVGRFHEGQNLQRFVCDDRWFSGFEESYDFNQQWAIVFELANLSAPLGPFHDSAKILLDDKGALTTIFPNADHFVLAQTSDCFASGPITV